MTGPVLYEATVPYCRKALENQIKLLRKGQEWCKENGHEETKLSNGRLVEDMMPLPFHVTFSTFNIVQFLVDLGATDATPEDIVGEGLSLDDLIARVERTLKVLEAVDTTKLTAKEQDVINIHLGNFSIERPALKYAHEIAVPSFNTLVHLATRFILSRNVASTSTLTVCIGEDFLGGGFQRSAQSVWLASFWKQPVYGSARTATPHFAQPGPRSCHSIFHAPGLPNIIKSAHMEDLVVLQCVARCSALALCLAGGGDAPALEPPPDADTDTDTDAEMSEFRQKNGDEDLQASLHDLESVMNGLSGQNHHLGDLSATKEIAASCKSICGRVYSAVPGSRGPKRIGTSFNTWKTSRPVVGSSRQGFEMRKFCERLQDLQRNLTSQVGKLLTNYISISRRHIRQIHMDSRRLQCQESDRLKILSRLVRSLEVKARSLQSEKSEVVVSSDDIESIRTQIENLEEEQAYVKQQHAMLKSLAFKNNVARHDTIPEAHQRTFSWVFASIKPGEVSSPGYHLREWLERGSGIFWISGKPGAGKSTLMKFIADHENAQEALSIWSEQKRVVIVSHYFWCAGTQMQRSHSGLLQTLLFEILRQLPDIMETLLPERWGASTTTNWTMAELYQTLYGAVGRADLPVKFCFFIDGLDEFEGDHLALCRELMTLAKSENVKLCLSSRPWSVFEETFGSGRMGHLRLHDVTANDIVGFVLDCFSRHSDAPKILSLDESQKLAVAISEKSQGVFLWVSLATKCLLEALSLGYSYSQLFEVLQQYPSELDDFFTYNLESIPKSDHARMATTLLITEAAEKPLDVGIYYFHEMEFSDLDYVSSLSSEPPSRLEHRRQLSQMTQKLDALCRGLLSVDQKTKVVNCLHRTVRDYLDQARIKVMLSGKAPPGFSPTLCLLRASAAWAKSSRAIMSEEPKSEFLSCITSLLVSAAQLYRPEDLALCQRLLDHVDDCLVAKGPGAQESLQIFRTQVISHRLWRYLGDIRTRKPQYYDSLEVPPLVLALFPGYEVGEVRERRPRWDEATKNTLVCLFDQGQNPNKLFSTAETLGARAEKTPWVVLCEQILPQHDDEHIVNIHKLQSHFRMALDTGILNAFLEHGANPNARCHRPGQEVSVLATDYLLHAFRLRADDDQVLKDLYLEHVHWFAPKEADHLNAVINDFFRHMDRAQGHDRSAFLQQVSEKLLTLSTQLQRRAR
ncbi:hypothetical protein NLG97_g1326 [Lecanicillium saksenae]|uniref:Uncharacterized protein n=1 Tax=Lecanicillium saksenae TaxID=468837 RepID=A0ACC1R862_9HYPO|nr:hypothetical protein NLG97_g1326 [Lecanicillium saksenae]